MRSWKRNPASSRHEGWARAHAGRAWRFLGAGLAASALQACVSYPPVPPQTVSPALGENAVLVADGASLSLSSWRAREPSAIILALHGMNDYGEAFADAAHWWAGQGLTTYAYDQRGFGRVARSSQRPQLGRWPGGDALRADLRSAIAAIGQAHPQTPLFVLGHSMGAAVALSSLGEEPLPVNGVILVSPAVWGGSEMPVLFRLGVNLAAGLAPGKTLTGARAGRQSSDNIEALQKLQRDPHVIKETRLDAVLGVSRLMGAAFDASDDVGGEVLLLIGKKDEIIPVRSMRRVGRRLCGAVEIKEYSAGWHLLLRDRQAENVWRDVVSWVKKKSAAGVREAVAGPAALTCRGV